MAIIRTIVKYITISTSLFISSSALAYDEGNLYLHNQSGCPITFKVTATNLTSVLGSDQFTIPAGGKYKVKYTVSVSTGYLTGGAYCHKSSNSNEWIVSNDASVDIPEIVKIEDKTNVTHKTFNSQSECEATIKGEITHGVQDGAAILLQGYSKITDAKGGELYKNNNSNNHLSDSIGNPAHVLDVVMIKADRASVMWSAHSQLYSGDVYSNNNYKNVWQSQWAKPQYWHIYDVMKLPHYSVGSTDTVPVDFLGYFHNSYISFGQGFNSCIIK